MLTAYLEAFKPYLIPGLFAFGATFVLSWLALWVFPKIGLMDRPHLYGLKRKPMPYSGGLILALVFFVSVFLFMEIDVRLAAVLVAAGLIVLVSFLDDRFRLSPLLRLFVQIVAALLVVLAGVGVTSITNPFGGMISLDAFQFSLDWGGAVHTYALLAVLFTVFWIVLLMNTVNWLDGLPGLVSGISILASVLLFVLSIRPHFHYIDQTDVAMFAIILAGASLAFWRFDFSPAKMLMGDTGSMFLGFMLAILSIFSGGKIATAFLIMGFPILDAFWVIVRRMAKGQSPLKGDLGHFHHRLLRAGFSERKVIVFIYALCALFGGLALVLGSHGKLIAVFVMAILMGILGGWIAKRGKRNEKF